MDFIRNLFSNLDWNSRTIKLGLAFIVPLLLFVLLSPGVLFVIDPSEKNNNDKIKRKQLVSWPTGFVHAFVFSLILFAFIYFYLLRQTS
jgi:hypothetical protein